MILPHYPFKCHHPTTPPGGLTGRIFAVGAPWIQLPGQRLRHSNDNQTIVYYYCISVTPPGKWDLVLVTFFSPGFCCGFLGKRLIEGLLMKIFKLMP